MKRYLLPVFSCIPLFLQAQALPQDTVPALIRDSTVNGATKFSSTLRDLRPIAGAPAPFYTYFWEFGDGTFSFEKDPQHVYRDTGVFDVRLYATNNYDDGKKPPTRPKKVPRKQKPTMLAALGPVPGFFKMDGSIALKNSCMPKPGDDMMLVLGYRNRMSQPGRGGTIALLYNDKEFSKNNFVLSESRVYHGESPASMPKPSERSPVAKASAGQPVFYASLSNGPGSEAFSARANGPVAAPVEELNNFRSNAAWKFGDLAAGEERFVFLRMMTTPEMLKDTNAVVRISAVFIPDDPMLDRDVFTIELPIVASHDPNKMSIRKSRMSYRLTGKHRELTYKVHFQNTGKGPAKKVDVGVSIPPIFDASTIRVSKTKPEVLSCDSGYAGKSCIRTIPGTDSVHFVFSNIYLPGTAQEGVNDADSTMGFVEYKIRFAKKPKKLPVKTGAAIVFDRNEPIYTNRATGKFRTGISPGLIAGYGLPFDSQQGGFAGQRNLVFGASISPYSSYRKYLQAELYGSFFTTAVDVQTRAGGRDTVIGKDAYRITQRQLTRSNRVVTLNLVPVSLRYSMTDFVGVGAGAMVSADIRNRTDAKANYTLQAANGTAGTLDIEAFANRTSQAFSDIRTSLFAEVALGRVRVGPSVGFRYFIDPGSGTQRMATLLTWKF